MSYYSLSQEPVLSLELLQVQECSVCGGRLSRVNYNESMVMLATNLGRNVIHCPICHADIEGKPDIIRKAIAWVEDN